MLRTERSLEEILCWLDQPVTKRKKVRQGHKLLVMDIYLLGLVVWMMRQSRRRALC